MSEWRPVVGYEEHYEVSSAGREWIATPQGVGAELNDLGKEAVRIAKARRAAGGDLRG